MVGEGSSWGQTPGRCAQPAGTEQSHRSPVISHAGTDPTTPAAGDNRTKGEEEQWREGRPG